MQWSVTQGDCLELLKSLPSGSVDAVDRIEKSCQFWALLKDEVIRMYVKDEMSMAAVASSIGVTQATVWKKLKEWGVQSRSKANHGRRNGRYKTGSQSRGYRKVVCKDKCERCGTDESLGIHHINDDHFDNREENLQVLCNSCHMSVTKKKWWDAKKAGLPLPKSNAPMGWRAIDHERWLEKQKIARRRIEAAVPLFAEATNA